MDRKWREDEVKGLREQTHELQNHIAELEKLLELWMLYYTDGLPDDELRELYCDSVDTQRGQNNG